MLLNTSDTLRQEVKRDDTYEWNRIFLEKLKPNSRSVFLIDPKIKSLFEDLTLPWSDILEYLKITFFKSSRELIESSHISHLLIFNSKNSDYLLHFVVYKDTLSNMNLGTSPISKILFFSVNREGVVDEIEYIHINQIMNCISSWLWQKCLLET